MRLQFMEGRTAYESFISSQRGARGIQERGKKGWRLFAREGGSIRHIGKVFEALSGKGRRSGEPIA